MLLSEKRKRNQQNDSFVFWYCQASKLWKTEIYLELCGSMGAQTERMGHAVRLVEVSLGLLLQDIDTSIVHLPFVTFP